MFLDVFQGNAGLKAEKSTPTPEAMGSIVFSEQTCSICSPVEHCSEGGSWDDLADRWSSGEEECGGAVRNDPGKHVVVELPSGDQANPRVVEGSHGNGSDASLSLQGSGPLEVEEEALLTWLDICPRRVPGGVERLGCGRDEVGDPEIAQESEHQRHSEGNQGHTLLPSWGGRLWS